jgi:hypothetical protein
VVRFSRPALIEGIEAHEIEGMQVHIYSACRTLAVCFKYRHKIGIDVAIEANSDALRTKKATVHEIHRFAKVLPCSQRHIALSGVRGMTQYKYGTSRYRTVQKLLTLAYNCGEDFQFLLGR